MKQTKKIKGEPLMKSRERLTNLKKFQTNGEVFKQLNKPHISIIMIERAVDFYFYVGGRDLPKKKLIKGTVHNFGLTLFTHIHVYNNNTKLNLLFFFCNDFLVFLFIF